MNGAGLQNVSRFKNVSGFKSKGGFTLIEVMIAVTVFVVIAVAITETASMRINNLIYLNDKTLAGFVAENRIAELQLNQKPTVGVSKDVVEMADREWRTTTTVESTNFPGLMRITVSVADAANKDTPMISLVTIKGDY